jgi:hypothetical protein
MKKKLSIAWLVLVGIGLIGLGIRFPVIGMALGAIAVTSLTTIAVLVVSDAWNSKIF